MNTTTHSPKTAERLQSLDVLRGFDMLWIIGGGSLVVALAKATNWGWLQVLSDQMEHVDWIGFHFEDLIFPLFMFISGVAIPYAVTARVEQGGDRKTLFFKVVKRGILLVLLGIFYNGALKHRLESIRVASVLGQIGLGYLFASTIVLYTKTMKSRLFWLIGIMGGIAVLQLAVPVPGYGAGHLDAVGGINAWLDRLLLPGDLYGDTYDPEGLLCVVSAITVTLMGAMAGFVLRDGKPASGSKSKILAIAGILLITVALALSPWYPIIKKAWTVPFNLLAAGISSVLLSVFYFVIDVMKWTNGIGSYLVLFFKVIGMNSITIYLAHSMIDFGRLSQYFTGWLSEPFGAWISVLGVLVLQWIFLFYLYRNKIFLRV